MFVVNTTSATAGSTAPLCAATRPRKRVPSSRRRNPGSATRVSANLALRCWCWSFGAGCCRRSVRARRRLQRNSGRRRRWWCCLLWRCQALLQYRARRRRVCRHQLQHEAEEEEDSAAPPARSSEKVSCLTNSNKSIGRGAGTAEIRGQTSAFAGLHQHGCHQHQAVDDEKSQKKRVKH